MSFSGESNLASLFSSKLPAMYLRKRKDRARMCVCKCTCVTGTGGWSMAVPSTFAQLCFQCDLLHFPPMLVLDLSFLSPHVPLGSLNSSSLQWHSPVGVLQNLYLLPKLQVLSWTRLHPTEERERRKLVVSVEQIRSQELGWRQVEFGEGGLGIS